MKSFEYENPVKILFGTGEVKRCGEEAKKIGSRVCLVSYKNSKHLCALNNSIQKDLEHHGLSVFPFYEIEANPEITVLKKGAEFCIQNQVDLVIGVGGGSAMDAAKVIAAGVYYKGDLWNMVYSSHSNIQTVSPEKALPTIMIPTLPATGSEMNLCAVVSNAALKEKSYVWAPCLYPRLSIIDPELTCSLPPFQTACAAADTISHVLEIYLNGEEDSDLQHYFQEGVMRTVIDNIGKVLEDPDDISARSHLQWAATCAINGWASPGDAWTPAHQVAHVLTAFYKVPHGASLSIMMPAWMKVLWKRRKKQYFRFAQNVMLVQVEGKTENEVILEGIQSFEEFLKNTGAPVRLKDMGIEHPDIENIVKTVVKVSFGPDGYLACNPPVSQEDIVSILKEA